MEDAVVRRQHEMALLDPRGHIHRFARNGLPFVGKRCPLPAGRREFERAVEARQRLSNRTMPAPFRIEVVVPEFTVADGAECLLVTPDLGEPLAMDRRLAGKLLPRSRLVAVLAALLDAGVEAPGFVPRNLFHRDGNLYVIDWEDADFAALRVLPGELTVMKWDLAWSDVFEADPELRQAFTIRRHPDPPLDSFERALADLVGTDLPPTQIRSHGIALTLRSELYVPGTADVTAAELGHLADEVLPAPHSVLYTALTARVREEAGDQAYAGLIANVWQTARERVIGGPETAGAAGEVADWLRALYTAADHCLAQQHRLPLTELHQQLADLSSQEGWDAACRRATLMEDLLARVCDFVISTLDLTGLQLILRGSLAQGMVSRRSDLDFELSGPQYPHGHRGVERLVLDILAAFDLQAEASEGRPTEIDIYDPGSGLGRDLHEWMELRRPGSHLHDPGWLGQLLEPDLSHLVAAQSRYEQAGRQQSAKYLWFEVRALLTRWTFRHGTGTPPVTIPQQIRLLREVGSEPDADEIQRLILASLALREQDTPPIATCLAAQDRVRNLRNRVGLPGPSKMSD